MSKILKYILLSALVCLFSTTIYAQNSQVTDSLQLETIVVTSSKTPTSSRETSRPVIVITEAQIKQNSGKDISEILNAQSGININGAWSNPGKDKGVYLQGASTAYTLILLDGQPVIDPSGAGGAFDIRLFPLDHVERIEVVKGSMSTLYGSDAIAGVINIITKKATDNKVQLNGLTSYGSHNSFLGSLGLNGRLNQLGYSVNYSREQTDGISEATDLDNTGTFDKDGFTRDALSAKVDVALSDKFTVSPTFYYSDYTGDFDADAFTDGDNVYEAQSINPGVNFNLKTDNLSLQGAYNYNKVDRSFKDAFGVSNFKGNTHNADVFATFIVNDYSKVLGGFNYQNIEMLDDVSDPSEKLISPYINLVFGHKNAFGADLGLRLNQHSKAGSNLNYSISPYYNISEHLRVLANISTGFKAPTLNEMYGPFGGNADLKPQKSRYIDVGLELFALDSRLNTKLIYFTRRVEDVIVYAMGTTPGYMNQDEQNDEGVELTAGYIVNSMIKLNGYYNYLTGEVTTKDDMTGEDIKKFNLIRRPKHKIGLNVDVNPIQNLVFNIGASFVGERTDLFFDPANFYMEEEVKLDPYTMLNAYVEYKFPVAGLILFGDVKNILNQDYIEVYGYNTLGTNVKFGLRFSL